MDRPIKFYKKDYEKHPRRKLVSDLIVKQCFTDREIKFKVDRVFPEKVPFSIVKVAGIRYNINHGFCPYNPPIEKGIYEQIHCVEGYHYKKSEKPINKTKIDINDFHHKVKRVVKRIKNLVNFDIGKRKIRKVKRSLI